MLNTRLTDEKFFSQCLDLSVPALSKARVLALLGRTDEAKAVFADHFRRTLNPARYLAGRKEQLAQHPEKVRANADRVLQHTFISCRCPYTFPDKIDWEANPTYNDYKEWTWQLNRHPEWHDLARAYLLFGEEKYAEEWTAELLSWAIQAQAPDEGTSGYATKCWRTIEAGIRMSCWTYCANAFVSSPAFTDEMITVFCKSLWEHANRLRTCCTSHNWLIMEMHGLLRITLFFPFFAQGKAWQEYANRRLKEEFDVQLYPDGMQYELSMNYHYCNATNYEGVLEMYPRAGLPAPAYLTEGLEKMYAMYVKVAAPDLFCPTMNDGERLPAATALANATAIFPENPVYRWFVTHRAEGTHPDFNSILLPWGGAAILRTGWDENALWAYMDCSPFGKAHQHEDKLNLQLWGYGHELLPEAGTFDYDTSEMRKYVLSTRGHNTAQIDGQDQNRRDGYNFLPEEITKKQDILWDITPARETVEATYNEGYGKEKIAVSHTRRLIFVKDAQPVPFFVTVDTFRAADEQKHTYTLLWHMHDNPTVLAEGRIENTYADGVGIAIVPSAGSINIIRGMKTPIFQGWLPFHGVGDVEHIPIPTAYVTGIFQGETTVATVLCPFRSGNPVKAVYYKEGKITVTMKDGGELVISGEW